MTKELDEKAGVVIIGKENVIMTGMVQKKLSYLIFLKDKQGAFYVCTSFRQQMLMYGKEASNRKQEIDRQHYTIPNQRPKDKHCGKI